MRFVSPRVHGVLDYLFAALFLFAPLWLDFRSDAAQLSAFVIGRTLLVLSLLTRYPLGVLRVIPFPVHGGLEMIAAPVLIALPWLAGFHEASLARNFFVGTGLVLLGLWAITDYRAAEPGKTGLHRPHAGAEGAAPSPATPTGDVDRAA
ncbi:SPW repeat domain-containing protein [Nannocystis punicea]|uniref:SPW repeat-containing integral membrane domain-containing protein n=1 Tax=Nannocystis punicea TaxID=2995304 RepID=A0ABY7HC19_9BACT|nr:hypothetical protein [Nannocystis poenicansa]WAS96549.1 hypothetical protein O0S08_10360 [Nannocystis poenicansa]